MITLAFFDQTIMFWAVVWFFVVFVPVLSLCLYHTHFISRDITTYLKNYRYVLTYLNVRYIRNDATIKKQTKKEFYFPFDCIFDSRTSDI